MDSSNPLGIAAALAASGLRLDAGAEVQHGDAASVIDPQRVARTGVPEVVFGATKTAAQIADLMAALAAAGQGALATRVTAEKAATVQALLGERAVVASYHVGAQTLTVPHATPVATRGNVCVVCAGTSDLPVAAEAAHTATFLGAAVTQVTDVGVAGLGRLLARLDVITAADVVIVVAGMEGALPSVLGGLVDKPIIAVPTSIGYGVAAGGFAALVSMLASCAPGITVVNIDNGFGAAVAAARIARLAHGA